SLLKAYSSLFGVVAMQVQKKEAAKAGDAARKKIIVILDAQEKQLTTLDEEHDEAQKVGEHIYENFQELETLMSEVKTLFDEKTQKELKAMLPIKRKSYEVTAIDFANKKMTVKHVSNI
ncbi:MAG TPA: hypothetical protein VK158_00615, partial [Acidobacteriota bacterium]|nr:hypothetical protein [Acidobacteriota bacterium]